MRTIAIPHPYKYDAFKKEEVKLPIGAIKQSGVECCFYLYQGLGVKVFYETCQYEHHLEERINEVMERQREGHSLHLAPAVHGLCKVLFVDKEGEVTTMYGYLTEVAEVTDPDDPWLDYDYDCPGRDINYFPTDNAPFSVNEWEEFCNQISTYFPEATSDLHSYNVGMLNGSLVCIDWGFN